MPMDGVCAVFKDISSPFTLSRKARGKLTEEPWSTLPFPLQLPRKQKVGRVNREGVVFMMKERRKTRDARNIESLKWLLKTLGNFVAGHSQPAN